MIILITGTPGSGKTLFAVSELLAGQFKDRPLLVNGIPQLLVPHQTISDQDVERWHEGGVATADGVPSFDVKNAVLVVDEVQRIARPRPASQKVPDWIAALETHRHKGVDLIIITQHPQLLDVNIRRLVGRHLHVRRTFALKSAVVYEWDHCENPGNVKSATTRLWRYPKKAFELYKSSELHTKAGGRVPTVVIVIILCALATPYVAYQLWHRLGQRFAGDETLDHLKSVPTQPGQARGSAAGSRGDKSAPVTTADWIASYKPRIAGLSYSAPAYDKLAEPKRIPLPAACIESTSKGCKCFTQDATPYDAPEDMCRQIVKGGVFHAFLETPAPLPSPAPRNAPSGPPAASPSGLIEIGSGGSFNVAAKPAPPPPETQPRVKPDSPWSFKP
jgi:zona occludens toxin